MVCIYVLECEKGRYYVGKSDNPLSRINDHFTDDKKRSIWTKLFKPIKVVEIVENAHIFDEDKYVKIYMSIYGIDKVRGGAYISPNLDPDLIKLIKREFTSNLNLCFKCKQKGHFINNCPMTKCFNCNKFGHYSQDCPKDNVCEKCGEKGHKEKDCFSV
jgi:hypothetical protein